MRNKKLSSNNQAQMENRVYSMLLVFALGEHLALGGQGGERIMMDIAMVQTVLSTLGIASIENRRTLLIHIIVVTVSLEFTPFLVTNVFEAFTIVTVEKKLNVQGLMPSVISRGNLVSGNHYNK